VHARPLSLHLPSPVKLQCTLQLSGQTHEPCFISRKIWTLWYSQKGLNSKRSPLSFHPSSLWLKTIPTLLHQKPVRSFAEKASNLSGTACIGTTTNALDIHVAIAHALSLSVCYFFSWSCSDKGERGGGAWPWTKEL
jgi:hypothetical protein